MIGDGGESGWIDGTHYLWMLDDVDSNEYSGRT
jgi:hypothetical protein